MRLKCRFTYPAISQALKRRTGEEDWMGFKSNGEDPIRNFRHYIQSGLLEKDGNEVVIYMDLQDSADDGQPVVAAVEEKGVSLERWYALFFVDIFKTIRIKLKKAKKNQRQ